MEENLKPEEQENGERQSEIVVNNYGETKDSAVVVDEPGRTVLLTEDETIVVEKPENVDVVPKNRPRKVYAGMWGTTEIVTVSLALLAVLTTILLFVLLVLPAKKELEANRAKRDALEKELVAMRGKYGSITDTEAHVAKMIESVNDFETRFLPRPEVGQTALYQRLNGLIASYGLVNTNGPNYEPLEIDQRQTVEVSAGETGKAKFQSIFPGVYVTTTVEGSYQNLRRFIQAVEASNQFVVVSAVELEPAEGEDKQNQANPTQATINRVEITPNDPTAGNNPTIQNNPTAGMPNPYPQPPIVQNQPARPAAPRGKTHGETVSLRLEMAAYFRRPDFAPLPVDTQSQ